MTQQRILLCVPHSDCHVVVNKLLEIGLRELGHDIVNLGVNCSSREIAVGIEKYRPSVSIITCQNGHALMDLELLGENLKSFNIQAQEIWIGGKLNTTGGLGHSDRSFLSQMGITHIFDESDDLSMVFERIALISSERSVCHG